MLLDPIDNYCERTGLELWSEPLNAISNLAFLIAAYALWRQYRRGAPDRPAAILIVLLALVGLGSTLFHTFANRLTMLGDVIPIGMFTFYYLWVSLRRLLTIPRLATITCLIAFAAVASQMSQLPHQFNGSVAYFPCLGALLIVGCLLALRRHASAAAILTASGLFALSLTFRSIDMSLCPDFPVGTHFLWHSINGVMLYLLVRSLMTRSAAN